MKDKAAFIKSIITTLAITWTGLFPVTYADESEVYFAVTDTTGLRPNVFFILDVSGSMDWDATTGSEFTITTGTRLDHLKLALYNLLSTDDIKKTNTGFMTFSSENHHNTRMVLPVTNSNSPYTDQDILIKSQSGNDVVFIQPTYHKYDNAYTAYTSTTRVMYIGAQYGNTGSAQHQGMAFGFRFSNILLKNYNDSGLNSPSDKGIGQVLLRVERYDNFTQGKSDTYSVYIDNADNAPHFETLMASDGIKGLDQIIPTLTDSITCQINNAATWQGCDVTELVRKKISSPNWKSGNAMTFYIVRNSTTNNSLNFYMKAAERPVPSEYLDIKGPYLKLTANNAIIAPNEATQLTKMALEVQNLTALGGTATLPAIFTAAKYISDKPQNGALGPYHSSSFPSPIERSCQSTHLVVMSDGDANEIRVDTLSSIKSYLNVNNCAVINGTTLNDAVEAIPGMACGRYLTHWLANTPQSTFNDNYVVTHAIGFSGGLTPTGEAFLRGISQEYGKGQYYATDNADQLAAAFGDIIFRAINAGSPAMSGRITISPESQYQQRKESYYSIFTSMENDYWPGNLKGFLLKYVDYVNSDGFVSRRPMLVSESGDPVLSSDGTFIEGTSSFWSSGDARDASSGGVVSQLAEPEDRIIYTRSEATGELIALNADNASNFTDAQLGTKSELERKALLNFARGYEYSSLGNTPVVAKKKIADAARAVASFATYGCNTGKSLLNCSKADLKQVILLPGNDGVLRAFDTRNGKTLYAFLPPELLSVINKMRQGQGVSRTNIRTYGLDGTVAIQHSDDNKNGYIDSSEKAYAFVTAGRGGKFAYIFDISDNPYATKFTMPTIKKIINSQTTGFSKLGNTWSVPASGKIKVGTDIKNVFIFGAGYNPAQDDVTKRAEDTIGNALYIIDVTGTLIWSSDSAGVSMKYSIPATPAVLVDTTTGLITDIVVGDMGGQLWRFGINNGATISSGLIVKDGNNGLVASIADNSTSNSRRFYITPELHQITDPSTGTNKLTVNIGSGYFGHPLNKEIKDKLYVFYLAKTATPGSTVITESMLSAANTTLSSSGFYVSLGQDSTGEGEKVITNLKADFNRVVFNTYVPNTNTSAVNDSCRPYSGKQRTYSYNLLTGQNMLESAYSEILIDGLPTDVALYCSGRACTFITDAGQLSATEVLPKGVGGSSSPLNVPLCGPDASKSCIHNIGWSDLFDPEPK